MAGGECLPESSSAEPLVFAPPIDTSAQPLVITAFPLTVFNSLQQKTAPVPASAKPDKHADTQDTSDSDGESKTTSDDQDNGEILDPKEIGMSSGLKHLYSGNEDKKGRFKWQTTVPKDLGKPAEDAETQKWAVLVRHIKVYNDPERVLAVHSIVVQSPVLKEVLKGVLKGYPGVTVGLQRLEFNKECVPLIHRWQQLNSAVEELRKKAGDTASTTSTASSIPQNTQASNDHGEDIALKTDADNEMPKEKTEEKTAQPTDDTSTVPVSVKEPSNEIQATAPATEEVTTATEATPDKAETSESPAEKETPQDEDSVKLIHAEILRQLLATEFKDLIESTQDMMSKGVMTYDLIWTLFQPGALIFTKLEGQERVCRLHEGKYGLDRNNQPCFWLMMLFVEYDGTHFGYQKLNVNIGSYSGTRAINTLVGYPLSYHEDQDGIRERLIARGTKVEALTGKSHYKSYDGIGWKLDYMRNKQRFNIKGRIMVDTYGWNKNVPNYSIYVTPFNREPRPRLSSRSSCRSFDSFDDDDDDDDITVYIDGLEDGMPVDGHFTDDTEEVKGPPLSDEQKLLCTHLVRGYALKQKEWLNLYVNSVHDLTFNTKAFETLVLPESQKELILGFASSKQSSRNQFDDVIEGKGRGIILLLCGPPGVGKTLTAETVAEEMQVPLFVMSAGDVGYNSSTVEGRLVDLFEMVTRWNAVLLLDEADVFLEERALHDIERNKIVSAFLRVLEYYEGIMFLTTNRVQTLDQAFQSRIHISLDYPELSMNSRKQIWKNFLDRHNSVQQDTRERAMKKKEQVLKDETEESKKQEEKEAQSVLGTPKESGNEHNSSASEPKPSKGKEVEAKVELATAAPVGTPMIEHVEDIAFPELTIIPTPSKPELGVCTEAGPSKNTTDLAGNAPTSPAVSESNSLSAEDIATIEKMTQPHSISKKDIETLARLKMNGRQIKNVLKTAQLLAQKRGEGLTRDHIQTVLDVTQHLHNAAQMKENTRGSIFS